MLPIKKVYVDTKYKTNDSVSTSHFKIELPQTLYLPDNTVFYVDDVAIPHSWYTVEDFNNKLYIRIFSGAGGGGYADEIITLTKQVYNGQTFATELASKLTDIGVDSVVTYNASKQTITISNDSYNFQFFTDAELKSPNIAWIGASYNTSNLSSANDLIKNVMGGNVYSPSTPFETALDLQPIRNIYITSPNLGNFNTMGPGPLSTVIKKVPVQADYNQMIFDQTVIGNDFLDCSKQTLRTIEFMLRDALGNIIPLRGGNVSLSIIFDQMNKDT